MKARSLCVAIAAACVLGAAGNGLYRVGVSDGKKLAVSATGAGAAQGAAGAVPGRKVLYWHDPMVPGHKFDKPGKSPFMDMQLVPVYADGESETNTVRISPRTQQNLGMRTAAVTPGSVAPGRQSLLVPSEALIRTGTRNVVIVSEGNGHFHPQEVQIGVESGDQTEILAGVSAGERVVTSGQFLIDSEASMKGVTARAIAGDKP